MSGWVLCRVLTLSVGVVGRLCDDRAPGAGRGARRCRLRAPGSCSRFVWREADSRLRWARRLRRYRWRVGRDDSPIGMRSTNPTGGAQPCHGFSHVWIAKNRDDHAGGNRTVRSHLPVGRCRRGPTRTMPTRLSTIRARSWDRAEASGPEDRRAPPASRRGQAPRGPIGSRRAACAGARAPTGAGAPR